MLLNHTRSINAVSGGLVFAAIYLLFKKKIFSLLEQQI